MISRRALLASTTLALAAPFVPALTEAMCALKNASDPGLYYWPAVRAEYVKVRRDNGFKEIHWFYPEDFAFHKALT